jgi:AcrR family transcriptional regulator
MSVTESTARRGATRHTAPSADARENQSAVCSSARARGREATRARLLESGRGLFAERGLHGVTTHDIAHAAEVASGTFYLHFKDKGELFREIVDSAVDLLVHTIEVECAGLDEIRDLVRAQSEVMVRFAEDNRELIRVLFSAESDATAVEADVLDRLANAIAQGRRERMLAGKAPMDLEPNVVGQAVVGMWARVLAWWSEDPARIDRDALLDTLMRIQLGGTHPERKETRA